MPVIGGIGGLGDWGIAGLEDWGIGGLVVIFQDFSDSSNRHAKMFTTALQLSSG